MAKTETPAASSATPKTAKPSDATLAARRGLGAAAEPKAPGAGPVTSKMIKK